MSQSHEHWHRNILDSSLSTPLLDHHFLYSYSNVIHGFSARLTPTQLLEIHNSPAHLISHEESYGRLFTTHSPKFLGLEGRKSGLWHAASKGKGSIIGVFDTGFWPESQSFGEEGMPPVPKRWKGKCHHDDDNATVYCNRKVIGAQVFTKGIQLAAAKTSSYDLHTPRDYHHHGTHTASTAAGNFVPGASKYGFASGTAKGVAPRAHLAIYKVGTGQGDVAESDVVAAMDQAVLDGVDVMSLSFGFDPRPFFEDSIAIASLSAVEKGISVVCAAGNQYEANTTANGAPWITTVGAGTLDRNTFAEIGRAHV